MSGGHRAGGWKQPPGVDVKAAGQRGYPVLAPSGLGAPHAPTKRLGCHLLQAHPLIPSPHPCTPRYGHPRSVGLPAGPKSFGPHGPWSSTAPSAKPSALPHGPPAPTHGPPLRAHGSWLRACGPPLRACGSWLRACGSALPADGVSSSRSQRAGAFGAPIPHLCSNPHQPRQASLPRSPCLRERRSWGEQTGGQGVDVATASHALRMSEDSGGP